MTPEIQAIISELRNQIAEIESDPNSNELWRIPGLVSWLRRLEAMK